MHTHSSMLMLVQSHAHVPPHVRCCPAPTPTRPMLAPDTRLLHRRRCGDGIVVFVPCALVLIVPAIIEIILIVQVTALATRHTAQRVPHGLNQSSCNARGWVCCRVWADKQNFANFCMALSSLLINRSFYISNYMQHKGISQLTVNTW